MPENWEKSEKYLQSVPVTDLTPALTNGHVVFCQENETSDAVLHKLINANLLAAPIRGNGGNVHGFVTLLDIVSISVDWNAGSRRLKDFAARIDSASMAQGGDLVTIKDIVRRRPSRHEFHVVPENATAADALEVIGRTGAHRLGVVSEESYYADKNHLSGVITQASVVKFLLSAIDELGPVVDVQLCQTRFYKDVISIDENTPAWEALQLMATAKISGVGVTEAGTGKLVDQISIKDVRAALNPREDVQFEDFALVAKSFREKRPHTLTLDDVVCTPTATIADVIRKLSRSNLHRVFVVDPHGCPIGLTTVRDVVHLLLAPPHIAGNRDAVSKAIHPTRS